MKRNPHLIYLVFLAVGATQLLSGCAEISFDENYRLRKWERTRLVAEELFLKHQFPEAEQKYKQAVERARLLHESAPFHLGASLLSLGEFYISQNDYRSAKPVLQEAVTVLKSAEITRSVVLKKLASQDLGRAEAALGESFLAERDFNQAQNLYLTSIELLNQWRIKGADKFEDNLIGQSVALSLYRLADICIQTGRNDESGQYYEQSLAVAQASAGPYWLKEKLIDDYGRYLNANNEPEKAASLNADKTWVAYSVDAGRKMEQGDYPGAEIMYKKAIAEAEKPGQDPLHIAISLDTLAKDYLLEERLADCEQACLRGLKISRDPAIGNSAVTEALLSKLIRCYIARRQNSKAIDCVKEQLAIRQDRFGKVQLRTAQSHVYLATLYQIAGDKKNSLEQASIAFDLFKNAGKVKRKFLSDLNDLAAVFIHFGDYKRADALVNDALSFYQEPGDGDVVYALLLWHRYCLDKLDGASVDDSKLWKEATAVANSVAQRKRRLVWDELKAQASLMESKNMLAEAAKLRVAAKQFENRH